MLELDAAGQVVATSPLRPFGIGDPLWLDPAGDRTTLLLGYAAPELADPISGQLPDGLESDPLSVADPCAPQLPAPLWAATLAERALSEVPISTAPALTAPWLEARCHPPDNGIDLDLRCAGTRCVTAFDRTGPCKVDVSAASCSLGTIHLSYDGSKLRCLELSGSDWTCTRSDDQRELFNCGLKDRPAVCPLELLPKGAVEGPSYDVARAHFGLLDPMPNPDAFARAPETVSASFLDWGAGFDLAPLEDRVVISASVGVRDDCPTGRERRLVSIDSESLLPIGSSTAPECLERLAAALDGPGFVGGFRQRGVPMIGRFDPSGALRHASAVETATPAARLFVAAIVRLPDLYVVQLDQRVLIGQEIATTELVFFDRDLSVAGRFSLSGGLFGLSAVPPDQVAVWARREPGSGSDLRLIRAPSGEVIDQREHPLFSAFRATDSVVIGPRIVLFADDDKEVLLWDRSPLIPRLVISPIGDPGQVQSAAVWPDGQGLIIGAGSGGTPPSTELRPEVYFIDPERERFLSGRRVLEGLGPFSRLRIDPRGRVWLLQPWQGDVVRLTPR